MQESRAGRMRTILQTIGGVIVLVVVIVLIVKFRGCRDVDHLDGGTIVRVPDDTTFAPVHVKEYQPPSLPFSKKKLPVRLPKGMDEDDVARVVTLEIPPDTLGKKKRTIDVIETKKGDVLVSLDSGPFEVTVTEIVPPLISFSMRFGAGVTLGRKDGQNTFSPAVMFAPVEWSGWLEAPFLTADLEGLGVGGQARVYHDVYIGIAKLWRYEEGSRIKLDLAFMF